METQDDGYDYFVYSPEIRDAYLSITCYGADSTRKIEEYFNFALSNVYPNNEPGFNLLETGDDIVGGVEAKWAKYESSSQGIHHLSILYMYIKHGQRFAFLGSAREEDFDMVFTEFIKIIKSIKSRKI